MPFKGKRSVFGCSRRKKYNHLLCGKNKILKIHSGIFTISLLVKISIKCSLPANITFVFFFKMVMLSGAAKTFFLLLSKK